MTNTPEELVKEFYLHPQNLSSRVGVIEKELMDCPKNIKGHFFYIRLKNGEESIQDLIDVANASLINYCTPVKILDDVLKNQENKYDLSWHARLITEARDLFIKTNQITGRSGELGELLLCMLLESFLHLPKAACKMYLKTSCNMPIHGADGIHIGFEGDNLVLFFGESKLFQSFHNAVASIIESVSNFNKDSELYRNEIRIIKSQLDINYLDETKRENLKKYFNPYTEEYNNVYFTHACLVGFDSNIYEEVKKFDMKDRESKLVELYDKKIDSLFQYIVKKVNESDVCSFSFMYLLLPFSSVEAARNAFQNKLLGR